MSAKRQVEPPRRRTGAAGQAGSIATRTPEVTDAFRRRTLKVRTFIVASVALATVAAMHPGPVVAAPSGQTTVAASQSLRSTVKPRNARKHQAALQAIADAHGGNRAAQTTGYDASVAYVADQLRDAGYAVEVRDFQYADAANATIELQRVSPAPIACTPGPDFRAMQGGNDGTAQAPITAVDLVLPPGADANTSTSGCEAADFAGFPAGDIALVQRGTCTFNLKALNATAGNRVRFAFWGADEIGLIGSTQYVAQLVASGEIADVAANLNFDMLGSPNLVRFVYDGDGSAFGLVGPVKGDISSAEIERVFVEFLANDDLETEPTAFDGRSDYGPFIAVGIPAGGLFSGAEVPKTPAQAVIYGGTAGVPYDPCYHLACDTFADNSDEVLAQFTEAVAHSVSYFAERETGPATPRTSRHAVARDALAFWGPNPRR